MAEKDGGKPAGVPRLSAKRPAEQASRQGSRQLSIKDIARLARVSHPTVSRALQNSPLVNVETAAKIRKIAEDQGYRASAVARGLVTRRTRTVGLVVTTVDDPFASEVTCGVEEIANDHRYAVFLANSHADPERERRMVQELAERRVDGIIVTSSRVGALYLPLLKELDVPIVLVNDQYPGEFVHSVMIANQEGTRAATEHLIELGHRRIAYVGDRGGYQSDAERLAGYKEALAGAGIEFASELAVEGDSRPQGASEAMEVLLRLKHPPTAVCCYNDITALGAMRAIRECGLRVPEDISVTGFDDLFFAEYLAPALTTVRQPMRKMGQMAMENLLKLMAGHEPAAQDKVQIRVEAKLIVRGSTGKARSSPGPQMRGTPTPTSTNRSPGAPEAGGTHEVIRHG
jgi:DNA-binding LacI/PurR family transcriptional regulator